MTTLIKRAFIRFRAFADGVRDWRVRTLVPVLAINVIVFAGLYVLMSHFGLANLLTTKQVGALILLGDVELTFSNQMLAHRADILESEVVRIARAHDLQGMTVYNAIGEPVVHGGEHPSGVEILQAQELLFKPGPRTQWLVRNPTLARLLECTAAIPPRSRPRSPRCSSSRAASRASS